MKPPRTLALAVLALIAVSAIAREQQEEAVDSGIVEQAQRRLMQIDVTVRGPAATLTALTAADFELTVGRTDIPKLVMDRVCIDDRAGELNLATAPPDVADAAPRLRTLLYFDQLHLTTLGRQRAMELARELIPQLLKSGRSEAMIVSAGRRLDVKAEWSSDPDALVAAIGALAEDPTQVTTWADQEDQRVDRLMAAIDDTTQMKNSTLRETARALEENSRNPAFQSAGLEGRTNRGKKANAQRNNEAAIQAESARSLDHARIHARTIARDLAREDAGRTAGGLSLFSVALQHLDAYAPPKAVIYFADTMRANPGDFFIDIVQASEQTNKMGSGAGQRDKGAVRLSTGNFVTEFQDVINRSTEKGVRLYTVQGRGLAPQTTGRTRGGSVGVSSKDSAARQARFKDAESALSGLARETGGKSFLGAADASQIASRILDDLSCLFVLSFHAIDLKEDRSTAVWIGVDQPGVELQYRPHLIALSDKARSRASLANAFWGGDNNRDQARIATIPTGFDKGKYTVLVQFAIPGSQTAASDWDMGITAVVGTSRTIEASGRVAVNQPGLPLVFEAQLELKPGDYEISAVAKKRDQDEIVSTKIEGTLLDPDEEEPFVASTVMLQRINGAFVRGKEAKTAGSLAHGSENWLRPDRPTGILALICGGKTSDSVTVVRRLEGAGAVSFDPVEVDFDAERCALLVDTVDSGTFTSGRFSYYVGLAGEGEIRQASLSDFLVVTPEEVAAARLGSNE